MNVDFDKKFDQQFKRVGRFAMVATIFQYSLLFTLMGLGAYAIYKFAG